MTVGFGEGWRGACDTAPHCVCCSAGVTNDAGTLTSQQRYLPFGGVRTNITSSPISQTDYGYTGQRDLGDMGLMDYKARFYSPTLGRFTQPDTLIPGASHPQVFNRYSYTSNNPVNFNDPSGHCRIENVPEECFAPGRKDAKSDSLDLSGYSRWEKNILKKLYNEGGPDAEHGVRYILRKDIHMTVGDSVVIGEPMSGGYPPSLDGDWQSLGNVEGWFDPDKNLIVLNPNSDHEAGESVDTWGLATIIHEAYHLEQGKPLTKYKELEAAQIGINVAVNIGGYYGGASGRPNTLPDPSSRDGLTLALSLSHDPEVINKYSEILYQKDFGYWIFYNFLPMDSN